LNPKSPPKELKTKSPPKDDDDDVPEKNLGVFNPFEALENLN